MPGTRPDPARELAELARTSDDLASFRQHALAVVQRVAASDVGLFHELSPRSALERAAMIGVSRQWLASTLSSWDDLAVMFGALVHDAAVNAGVAHARRALAGTGPVRTRIRKEWSRRIARPLGARDVVMLHLIAHERVVSAVVLGRSSRRAAYSGSELAQLGELVPTLTVCDAWLQQRSGAPRGMPVSVRCMDGRPTPRQRSVVEQVALGHADHEIARALEISPHTVRNLLVTIRARLGAANRAELVHRAVFR